MPTPRRAPSPAFNTITVSDGISMGSPGMRCSLVSREVIADSIKTVGAPGFDGFIALGGCDKNMPGRAMARLDRPSVFVYGGTIQPGKERRDVVSVFEAVGKHAAGAISDIELKEVESTAIPGAGSCGGMYTANTMASAIEALGLSLPGSSAMEAIPTTSARRHRAGAAVLHLLSAAYAHRTSSVARPSRTRSRLSSPSKGRRMQSFTCSPSRTRQACHWNSTTSRRSARAFPCSQTCARPASTP